MKGRALAAEVRCGERARALRPSCAGLSAARGGPNTRRQIDGEGGAAYSEPDITTMRAGPSPYGSLFTAWVDPDNATWVG